MKPALVSVSEAVVASIAYTLGTATPDADGVGDGDGVPLETTMFTAEPLTTLVPASGILADHLAGAARSLLVSRSPCPAQGRPP